MVDWTIHGVFNKDGTVSYHTHGLNRYKSLEVEMNLPLQEKQAALFMNTIGKEIANGRKIEDGEMAERIFNLPVFFFKVKSIEHDEEMMRVVFPDPNGLFPWEKHLPSNLVCQSPYDKQISFNNHKAFILFTKDNKTIEDWLSASLSPFNWGAKFRPFENGYAVAVMYWLADGEDTIYTLADQILASSGLASFTKYIKNLMGLKDIKVLCRDVDFGNMLYKDFKDYLELNT